MKIIFSTARIAIVTTVFFGLLAGSASASPNPIPGVDIIVKKNPGGRAIKATTDKAGQFSMVVKEPGQYSVSIVRKAGKSTPEQLSITASGTTLKESSPMSYAFTVGREPVTLRGMVSENDSPRPTKRSARSGDDAVVGGDQRVATEDTMGALMQVSTTRGRLGKPGEPDGDGTSLPGKIGDPIQGIPIGLEGDPEGARVGTTTTDQTGAFRFGKVPAGNYRLVIAGQPDRLLSVGADGIASGKVMRGENGRLSIFDRWGKAVAASKAENKIRAAGAENGDVLPGAPVSTSRSNKKR